MMERGPRRDDRRDTSGYRRGGGRYQDGDRGREERRDSWSRSRPSDRRAYTDPARLAAYDLLRDVDEVDAYANLLLPSMLRHRGIRGRDAGFATELAYGTLRMRGRYDAIIALCTDRGFDDIDPPVLDALRLGAHQLLGMRVPVHAAVSETVSLVRERISDGASHFANAVLRTISEQSLDDWLLQLTPRAADDLVGHLAVVESHPAWIVRALREALVANGRPVDELADLLVADNTSAPLHLVARPGLISREELLADLIRPGEPGELAPTSIRWSGDPGAVPAVRDGRAAVQDEGSQLVALLLAAATVEEHGESGGERAGEQWLDLCAGPGGKAALLAAIAAQRGAYLVANEINENRAQLVEQALDRLRDVSEVRVGDGTAVVAADEFDRVLADVPCSGLGALRRRPEARWRRTPSDVGALGRLQRELLASAIDATRPGGVIAYATCSPHLAETRLVVADVLRRRSDVEPIDAAPVLRDVVGHDVEGALTDGAVQLWPHLHGTDAMFVQLLRRTDAQQ